MDTVKVQVSPTVLVPIAATLRFNIRSEELPLNMPHSAQVKLASPDAKVDLKEIEAFEDEPVPSVWAGKDMSIALNVLLEGAWRSV